MNGISEDDTNVIKFDLNRRSTDISNSISHPESKWFDDPLEDLLNEFSDDSEELDLKQKDYIHHLEHPKDQEIKFEQDALEMSSNLISRVDRLKESVQRLKYYLNEMNLED